MFIHSTYKSTVVKFIDTTHMTLHSIKNYFPLNLEIYLYHIMLKINFWILMRSTVYIMEQLHA